MSTSVLYREPAPARGSGSRQDQRFGQLVAAQAAALFTSDLSALCEHTRVEVTAAIRHAIGAYHGIGGCAAEVATAYGEHPETAARRMRWALTVIEGINAPADWPGASS